MAKVYQIHLQQQSHRMFNRQLKARYKTKQGLASFASANNPITMCVFFYNFVRLHSALDGLKPSKKRKRAFLLVAWPDWLIAESYFF